MAGVSGQYRDNFMDNGMRYFWLIDVFFLQPRKQKSKKKVVILERIYVLDSKVKNDLFFLWNLLENLWRFVLGGF